MYNKQCIINPLLTILLGQDDWILSSFYCFASLWIMADSVSVHKHPKKELGQYPAILTSHFVNNPSMFRLITKLQVTATHELPWINLSYF